MYGLINLITLSITLLCSVIVAVPIIFTSPCPIVLTALFLVTSLYLGHTHAYQIGTSRMPNNHIYHTP